MRAVTKRIELDIERKGEDLRARGIELDWMKNLIAIVEDQERRLKKLEGELCLQQIKMK